MTIEIRETQPEDMDALIELTVLGFEPVFASFAQLLGDKVFPVVYPDWKALQTSLVKSMFEDEKILTYVAEHDGIPAGFMSAKLDDETKVGEIYFLVVHPEHQQVGVGTQLNEFALSLMREAGMKVATVSTGGDPSHAPARASYEKIGFKPFPNVWYFQNLE